MSKNSIIDNQVEHKYDCMDEPLSIIKLRDSFSHCFSIENNFKQQLGIPIELLKDPYTKSTTNATNN